MNTEKTKHAKATRRNPPRVLTASDYEGEKWDGRAGEWFCSRAFMADEDGGSMHYNLRKQSGRWHLYFEGGHLGPKKGYASRARAIGAIVKGENEARRSVWSERIHRKTGKRVKVSKE